MTQKKWNWQQSDWPNFSYDSKKLIKFEEEFLQQSGMLLGAELHIDSEDANDFHLDLLSSEALDTSAIEGEILDRQSIQSSIKKQLGFRQSPFRVKVAEAGVAQMMVDVFKSFKQPLSQKKLCTWHAMLMQGRHDLEMIGAYRKHSEAMQIISGHYDNIKIHFEAPPSKNVPKEMQRFIKYFNQTAPGKNQAKNKTKSQALPALVRAALVHLYFESVHPFEDGNGRLGRALSEKVLAQSLNRPSIVGLSPMLLKKRSEYYLILEKSNKNNQVDDWIEFFAQIVLEAQKYSQAKLNFIIKKNKFYQRFGELFNDRQLKVIDRIFKAGIDGFVGGLSAENYLSITKTSRATATRDLADLVKKNILAKRGVGKGTRYDLLL